MGQFNGIKFTTRGIALQAKAQAGADLHFTRLAMGDGDLGSTDIATLTALISQKKSMPVSKLTNLNNGKAVVGAAYSNTDITTGFYFRELGVFANDPDLGEILYCYGNAGVSADFIPAGGSGSDIIEQAVNVITIVGNAATVTADIDSSLVFVTQQELEDVQGAIDTINAAGWVTTTRLGSKAVTAAKLADGAATDLVIGNRTISDTAAPGGDTGTLTNLFSWLGYMIKAITGKTGWRVLPAITLEATKTHVDKTSSVHGSTSTATPNTIAQRDADGQINLGTPTANSHAATKQYADNKIKWVSPSDDVLVNKGTVTYSGSSSGATLATFHIKYAGKYRLKGEIKATHATLNAGIYLVYVGGQTGEIASSSGGATVFASFSYDLTIFIPANTYINVINFRAAPVTLQNLSLCGVEGIENYDVYS
jgi:hypothetical protein